MQAMGQCYDRVRTRNKWEGEDGSIWEEQAKKPSACVWYRHVMRDRCSKSWDARHGIEQQRWRTVHCGTSAGRQERLGRAKPKTNAGALFRLDV